MASRSSSSTSSARTSLRRSSTRSRTETPSQGRSVTETKRPPNERAGAAGPAQKNHKSLAEVQVSGRQSAQGDRPKAGPPPASGRRTGRGKKPPA
jgi:hypothetical protein